MGTYALDVRHTHAHSRHAVEMSCLLYVKTPPPTLHWLNLLSSGVEFIKKYILCILVKRSDPSL